MLLLRLFKNSRTAGTAGIFLLLLALFLPSIIGGAPVDEFTGMPFYSLIFGSIHKYPVLNRLLAMLVFLIGTYMLVRISARYVLIPIRSFMPAFFFLLFTLAQTQARQISPDLLGSLFFLFAFAILFDTADKPRDTFMIFNAGLTLALGSMFCAKLVWFIPLFWISLAMLRTVSWRELLYPVVAFLLTLLLLFTWYWGLLSEGNALWEILAKNLSLKGDWAVYTWSSAVYYGWFLLMILLASFHMIGNFQSRKTVVQNIYQVLFFIFMAGALYFTLLAHLNSSSLIFAGFPVAFIMANYLHRKRNHWIHEVLLIVLVGLLVLLQFTAFKP